MFKTLIRGSYYCLYFTVGKAEDQNPLKHARGDTVRKKQDMRPVFLNFKASSLDHYSMSC